MSSGHVWEVWGLELDLISILFKKDHSDGILKDPCLKDEEEDWRQIVRNHCSHTGSGRSCPPDREAP
jgi:hypothetical protein